MLNISLNYTKSNPFAVMPSLRKLGASEEAASALLAEILHRFQAAIVALALWKT